MEERKNAENTILNVCIMQYTLHTLGFPHKIGESFRGIYAFIDIDGRNV